VNPSGPILKRVQAFCGSLTAFPFPGMVVALSGGPDSVALTRFLVAARGERTVPLALAHLNHQLRGSQSDADEEFVRRFHASLVGAGVPDLSLSTAHCDVRSLALQGANLEAVARRERYRWLGTVAREQGLGWVGTGHTASDQAETVLHHLLRGTGLAGLRGIAPRRELEPGVWVARPLLTTTRAEILACLEAWGQEFREDASNEDARFTRNRIRAQLLPHLASTYNAGIASVLTHLAEQARELWEEHEERATALLREAELPRAGDLLVFDRSRLQQEPRHRVRTLFRLVWAREGWPMGKMGYDAWDRLASVVFDTVQAVDLPGSVHARGRGRVLQVGRKPGRRHSKGNWLK
jgi:tRNA(Ile)-lysidine synthase